MGHISASAPLPSTQAGTDTFRNKGIQDVSLELYVNLHHIADDVVNSLGCVGAMVATLEPDNRLPVRAYSIDAPPELLKFIEMLETKFNIGFVSSQSVAYLDDEKYKDNLSVRAIKGTQGHPEIVVSDDLYDLFRPVLSKRLSEQGQKLARIKQVIAVPFFIDDEVVGNLFAATQGEFSEHDTGFLRAFGRQAATTIQSQRRLAESQALERVTFDLQASITDETHTLQIIVDAVVQKLGYVGAMVATLEPNNSLPVRAYAVDASPTLLKFFKMLETKFDIGFINSKSVAYLNDEKYQDNLSMRAIKRTQGHPEIVVSNDLYDLFRPVLNKRLSEQGQKLARIKQVIAVPFFIDDEVVGNLFAATRRLKFSEREKEILTAFGQQAAVGIRNARLYRKSEERRQIAQGLARMAFSASAYIHTLRNDIGAFQMYSQIVRNRVSDEKLHKLGQDVEERLNNAADILDSLHEPWGVQVDVLTEVNTCLQWALEKLVPDKDALKVSNGITVHFSLSENLPMVKTAPDLLIEAFKILIKNALEALDEKNKKIGQGGDLWIESRSSDDSSVEVLIYDNGIGISPEDLNKIFELGWTTKKAVTGFSLFWAKEYIEGQGGHIEVQSIWQEGAKFRINLRPFVA